MENGCQYERVPQAAAEEILGRLLEFRDRYDSYTKPDDVNALLSFFPHVRLQEGYVLDYEIVSAGHAVQHIAPYARSADGEDLLLLDDPGAEGGGEDLYGRLSYEQTPLGLFEYAFFITELMSTRGSWHATEWLASTPVFTEERFEAVLEKAGSHESLARPDWFGPLARLEDEGGEVRFLVYTEMGWERIYYLSITVARDGTTHPEAGAIVADLGQGLVF